MDFPPQLFQTLHQQPYSLLFATISGSHLYGFSSPDSDYDLRGVHILPLPEVVGLEIGKETIELSKIEQGVELDFVSHDLYKFFHLLLKKNGYVLEQLYSPLILHSTPEHQELKAIAKDCITRHHSHHYFGFAQTQWKLFSKENPPRVKPLLYVYRVLLTGIHLMRTGEIEANLLTLNQGFQLPYLDDLVAQKLKGEKSTLTEADLAFHQGEYERLRQELQTAFEKSSLPENSSAKPQLNDLLIRLRLK